MFCTFLRLYAFMLLDVLDVLSRFCIPAVERQSYSGEARRSSAEAREQALRVFPPTCRLSFAPGSGLRLVRRQEYPGFARWRFGERSEQLLRSLSLTRRCPRVSFCRGGWLFLPSFFVGFLHLGWRCNGSLDCRLCCRSVAVLRFVRVFLCLQPCPKLRA